jgi:hypothetical protein
LLVKGILVKGLWLNAYILVLSRTGKAVGVEGRREYALNSWFFGMPLSWAAFSWAAGSRVELTQLDLSGDREIGEFF